MLTKTHKYIQFVPKSVQIECICVFLSTYTFNANIQKHIQNKIYVTENTISKTTHTKKDFTSSGDLSQKSEGTCFSFFS